ncbi:GW dipeptide domain-containing protein [Neobacillus mesonae]|uniref:GW dipeptide domain-containing protein n=1 Tax=Neobacillus mesonae TaxID=1193713 RepID=UPI002E2010BE|nr:GW dipeptide domain-containing protein [Neobacillus mesonae]
MRKAVILVLTVLLAGVSLPARMSAEESTDTAVNDYILQENSVPAKVEYNYKSFFPKLTYRNGIGEVEGVVAHETANNSSTISGEISYMSRNYRKAFVHAFVDDSRVIEIHSPNYGAWGAGSAANQRFVHIELVRVKTFEQFARSINNYAAYIASMLYRYNLPVIDAEKTGSGTLWSHKAVTNFLGRTTHKDPHGYFEKWDYNWNQFVQLVMMKYQQLPDKEANTNRLGQVRSNNAAIFQNYNDSSTRTKAGTANINKTLFVKKLALVEGQLYYLLSEQTGGENGNRTVGWVKAGDIISYPNAAVDQRAKTLYFTGKGSAYSIAWGAKKDVVINSLSIYKDREFKINKTEKVGNNIWYRGSLNGKTVWIQSIYLGAKVERTTSRLGRISNGSVKIFKTIGNPEGVIQAGSANTDKIFYIKKQATVNGAAYYLLSSQPSSVKGVIGWVKSTDLASHTHVGVDQKAKLMYLTGNGGSYSKPWGSGKDTVYKTLSKYKNKEFKVNLTEKVGNDVWYRGSLNGKTVWIHSSHVKKTLESTTSRLGIIKNSNIKIYKTLGSGSSYKVGSAYTNKVFYIKRQGKLSGQTYYRLSKNSNGSGMVGWVKSTDLTSNRYTVTSFRAKTMRLSSKGSAYSKPWGGTKDVVYRDLASYKNRKFTARQTAQVGTTHWYQVTLAGKTVWIKK